MSLFNDNPKIGLVIGTLGTPAYVRLHLETAKQLYPDVPILVHDDGSDVAPTLDGMCMYYGADFAFNYEPLGHYRGDLSVFVRGLQWAEKKGIDMLVKMSRRFLPLRDWRKELTDLALEGNYASFSSYCEECRFMFRTECVGMHVRSWYSTWVDLWRVIRDKEDIGLLEAYFHTLAKRVHRSVSDAPGSYVYWPIMGTSKFRRIPDHLWHGSCSVADYAARAQELGLSMSEQEFSCS